MQIKKTRGPISAIDAKNTCFPSQHISLYFLLRSTSSSRGRVYIAQGGQAERHGTVFSLIPTVDLAQITAMNFTVRAFKRVSRDRRST